MGSQWLLVLFVIVVVIGYLLLYQQYNNSAVQATTIQYRGCLHFVGSAHIFPLVHSDFNAVANISRNFPILNFRKTYNLYCLGLRTMVWVSRPLFGSRDHGLGPVSIVKTAVLILTLVLHCWSWQSVADVGVIHPVLVLNVKLHHPKLIVSQNNHALLDTN